MGTAGVQRGRRKAPHDALRKKQEAEREAAWKEANDEFNRICAGIANSLAELIRYEAKGSRRGYLSALLHNVELSHEWESRLCQELGEREASFQTIGTVLDFLSSESARELRRAICGTTPDNPDEDQIASAWVDGRLVVSLPLHLSNSYRNSFLIVDPPAQSG